MGLVRGHDGVRSYDFQRPHQLSRAQAGAITVVVATFWRAAANFLSGYLRTPVQLQQLGQVFLIYARVPSDTPKLPTYIIRTFVLRSRPYSHFYHFLY